MASLYVIPIRDLSAEYGDDDEITIKVNCKSTVGRLRRRIAERFAERTGGARPKGVRIYGVSGIGGVPRVYRFSAEEILLSGDDDQHVLEILRDLKHRGRVESKMTIGVVFHPADPADDAVEVVRDVDTVAERIAAGRANAIDVDGGAGSEEGGSEPDEDDEGPPRAKRARREGSSSAGASDDGEGEDGDAGQEGHRDEERGTNVLVAEAVVDAEEEGQDDPAEEEAEGQGTGNDDAPDEVAAAAAADNAVGNAAGEVEAVAVVVVDPAANAAGAAASPLRLWLRGLEVDGAVANRFERYAPAFEREFASLVDLALVPAAETSRFQELFEKCGVEPMGDQLRLERAIRTLPQPE